MNALDRFRDLDREQLAERCLTLESLCDDLHTEYVQALCDWLAAEALAIEATSHDAKADRADAGREFDSRAAVFRCRLRDLGIGE